MRTRLRDLIAGLVPHLHAAGSGSATAVSAATHDGAAAPANLEPAGCIACRSGQSSPVAIGFTGAFRLPVQADALRLHPRADASAVVARLVRASSPPRAPPV